MAVQSLYQKMLCTNESLGPLFSLFHIVWNIAPFFKKFACVSRASGHFMMKRDVSNFEIEEVLVLGTW